MRFLSLFLILSFPLQADIQQIMKRLNDWKKRCKVKEATCDKIISRCRQTIKAIDQIKDKKSFASSRKKLVIAMSYSTEAKTTFRHIQTTLGTVDENNAESLAAWANQHGIPLYNSVVKKKYSPAIKYYQAGKKMYHSAKLNHSPSRTNSSKDFVQFKTYITKIKNDCESSKDHCRKLIEESEKLVKKVDELESWYRQFDMDVPIELSKLIAEIQKNISLLNQASAKFGHAYPDEVITPDNVREISKKIGTFYLPKLQETNVMVESAEKYMRLAYRLYEKQYKLLKKNNLEQVAYAREQLKLLKKFIGPFKKECNAGREHCLNIKDQSQQLMALIDKVESVCKAQDRTIPQELFQARQKTEKVIQVLQKAFAQFDAADLNYSLDEKNVGKIIEKIKEYHAPTLKSGYATLEDAQQEWQSAKKLFIAARSILSEQN